MPTGHPYTPSLLDSAALLDAIATALRAEAERAAARDGLLRRCRAYLGDGHAGTPLAAAIVSEINDVLGEG